MPGGADLGPGRRSLPDGLDTIVGDRGYRLSGGEKQRVALARLLLKAPAVVVLDEATAHLDSESEAAVQRALAAALAGRTSLVIAHRLSTIREADQILVIEAGRVVERGRHDELLAAGGLYAELYRTQFARQEPARPGPGRPVGWLVMRMLVTGGAGFIGANFVHYTRARHPEYEIRVLDALTYAGNRESLARGRPGRLRARRHLRRRAGRPAGRRAPTWSSTSRPSRTSTTRCTTRSRSSGPTSPGRSPSWRRSGGTAARLHHISTDEVFGDLALDAAQKFTEQTRYDPSSPYSASKASSDMLVRAWARSYGVAATLSNCANNYGPYQHVEKFVPRQITNVLTGQRPKLYGAGANVREWTHVDDHNAAVHLILAGGAPGQTYLIGTGDERSNAGIMALVLELMGQPADAFDHVPDRPGHDLRYANDSTRIRAELGWQPRYGDFRAGLAATIDWYRDNDWWWRPQKDATEARYQLLGR